MDPFEPQRPVRNPFDEPDHPGAAYHTDARRNCRTISIRWRRNRVRSRSTVRPRRIIRRSWTMRSVRRSPAGRCRCIPAASFRATICCRTTGTRTCWRASRRPPHAPCRRRSHSPRHASRRNRRLRHRWPRPRAPPQARADDGALLAAFLEGAGMQDARPSDPAATMLALGKAFRALVAGLRAVLIARAADQERVPHRADDDPGARQQSAEILRRRRRRAGRAARRRPAHRHGAARGGRRRAARHPAARTGLDGGDAGGGARAVWTGSIRRSCAPAPSRAAA